MLKKKKNIKNKLKLIKIIMFVFGFLVFTALFMGINSTESQKKASTKKQELEKSSLVVPRSFIITPDDYKITSEQYNSEQYNNDISQEDIAESNIPKDSMRVNDIQIPSEFDTFESYGYTRESTPQPQRLSNPSTSFSSDPIERTFSSNPIERAFSTLSQTKALTQNQLKQDTHVEQGKTSGLFVNTQGITAPASKTFGGELMQGMSGQLANALGNLNNGSSLQDNYSSQNNQPAKQEFLNAKQTPKNNYTLADRGSYNTSEESVVVAGTIIPIVMVTAINSDLPGMISARVTEDVYDTFYGTDLIIPKGSMIIGDYDSSVSWGQKRLLIVWQRLTRPDGLSLSLEGMQGIDQEGSAGVNGKVKSYVGASIGTSILTSMFNLGVNYTSYTVGSVDESGSLEQAIDSTGRGVRGTLKTLADKFLNRQPTIKVKAGTQSNIFVHKDINIPPFKITRSTS